MPRLTISRRSLRNLAVVVVVTSLSGCGGGGGGGGPPPGSGWVAGVFQPSPSFAARCVAPRAGTSDMQGTTLSENNWLRSWTNELYLWYREVPDQDPGLFSTSAYFDALKTSATTASGAAKDKFHFTYSTAAWIALSQSGVQAGYGAQWVLISATPPREVVVAYTDPGSPAEMNPVNLARGAEVLAVDNVDLINSNDQASIDTLNAGLFPTAAGQLHSFLIRDVGQTVTRTVSMTSANVTSIPVQNVTTIASGSETVGYMLFNDHIATAEGQLITAVNILKAANINDLVLDIRYNGGGYLDIASEVAYMIAGSAKTAGQTFELLQFNDKNPSTDPVTGAPITPTPFHSTAQGFSGPTQGTALPTLNLPRVFVLTSGGTCSASESIINSLRGIGVDVIQIGSTTCGKPYGFYPQDNCGTTYFSIEFRGVNAMGFGDYTDGFSPANTAVGAGVTIPGCSVADDFTHALGDPNEGRLAAALNYLSNPVCGPATGFAPFSAKSTLSSAEGVVPKSPMLENRILRQSQ
jgi:carboxyl-terminal processing protease